MIKEEAKSGQQTVRPAYLIFAGVAVVAMVIFWVMNQSQASPPPEIVKNVKPKLAEIPLPVTQAALQLELDLSRNPFLAPGIIKIKKQDDAKPAAEIPGQLMNVNDLSAPESTKKVVDNSRPRFKGSLAGGDDSLVMIEYQNKTHLLRSGDRLPGSEYRLGEIEPDAVLLVSREGRLKLEKKEEAE